jgi:CheY-like chemotaxis protein
MVHSSRNVLIVDDDPLVAATLKRVLVDRGHSASLAPDGRAALHLLTQERFDFVLLDIFMPNQDGIETLRMVKRAFPEMPVGMISGGGIRGRFEFLDIALKLGADGVAQKPVTPEQLCAMVERKQFSATSEN